MFDEIIKLNRLTIAADTYGDEDKTETETEVFARVKSVGMQETYIAKEHGFKPEVVFEIPDYLAYQGQERIEYQGEDYRVVRVYRRTPGTVLEIVCARTGNVATNNPSTISPSTAGVYRSAIEDVVVYVSRGTVSEITRGGVALSGTAYTIKYQRVTFHAAYLQTLPDGSTNFVVVTDNGNLPFAIEVI